MTSDKVSVEREELRQLRNHLGEEEPPLYRGMIVAEYHRSWETAMSMLDAMIRKPAEPEAQTRTRACPHCENCDTMQTRTVCNGCKFEGNCALQNVKKCPMRVPSAQTSTPPPHYDPATVAFPFREELKAERQSNIDAFLGVDHTIDEIRGEVASVSDQIGMHCREPHVTQGELDALKAAVAEAMKVHEENHWPDALPKGPSCSTCHHYAVCIHVGIAGCESWEGQHPR
jgi:hypothetical protein